MAASAQAAGRAPGCPPIGVTTVPVPEPTPGSGGSTAGLQAEAFPAGEDIKRRRKVSQNVSVTRKATSSSEATAGSRARRPHTHFVRGTWAESWDGIHVRKAGTRWRFRGTLLRVLVGGSSPSPRGPCGPGGDCACTSHPASAPGTSSRQSQLRPRAPCGPGSAAQVIAGVRSRCGGHSCCVPGDSWRGFLRRVPQSLLVQGYGIRGLGAGALWAVVVGLRDRVWV